MSKLVVIGGSAGSFQSIRKIIENLPEKMSFSLIVLIHQKEESKEGMANVFQKFTTHKIFNAEDAMEILSGLIYIAPPMYHLQVETNHTFSFALDEPIYYSRPSLDILFQTAAWTYQEKLCAIVLSGASKDGVRGAKVIIKYHGTVCVQDPNEAESDIMPLSVKEALSIEDTYTIDELIDKIRIWGGEINNE